SPGASSCGGGGADGVDVGSRGGGFNETLGNPSSPNPLELPLPPDADGSCPGAVVADDSKSGSVAASPGAKEGSGATVAGVSLFAPPLLPPPPTDVAPGAEVVGGKGGEEGREWPRVRYYTFQEECWHEADTFPCTPGLKRDVILRLGQQGVGLGEGGISTPATASAPATAT
ncbi:unnamed protein product, partial [Discosporangium mesarthrocarpum]